jgi:signal transduction histidine kinase
LPAWYERVEDAGMVQYIREFFEANRVIVLFVYGQVFFVLGMVIALQSWRHSRLALARSLRWLAAFGIAHGLYEWGLIFIPVQAGYLAHPLVELLWTAHAVQLAVSFALLFQFGVDSLRPLPGRWWLLRAVPVLVLVLWFAWAFGPALALAPTLDSWLVTITVIARYLIGFPAALLAALGLAHQARQLAATYPGSPAPQMLRVGALALGLYSVLGGLVVSHGPASTTPWLTSELVGALLIVPVPVLRGLLGLTLAVAVIRSLDIFQLELDRRLTAMEEEQILVAERERLGRELHDGTLQTIYAAGLLLQSAERELARCTPATALGRLQQSMTLLNTAVSEIRAHIGALRPAPDGRTLISGLRELAGDQRLCALVDLDLTLELPEERPLPPAAVAHLLAITSEALSNVARHANATQASIRAVAHGQRLALNIHDNGRGLPADTLVGYGLRNMRDRARLLGGELVLQSEPGHGTTVTVDIPWSEPYEPRARPVS